MWLEEWKDSNEVEVQETLQLEKQMTSKEAACFRQMESLGPIKEFTALRIK